MDALRRPRRPNGLPVRRGSPGRACSARTHPRPRSKPTRPAKPGHCRRTPGALTRSTPRRASETGPTSARRGFPLPGETPADSGSGDAGQRSAGEKPLCRQTGCPFVAPIAVDLSGSGRPRNTGDRRLFLVAVANRCPAARSSDRPSRHCRQAPPPAPLVPAVQRPVPPLPPPLVAAPVESPQPATAVRTPVAAPRAGATAKRVRRRSGRQRVGRFPSGWRPGKAAAGARPRLPGVAGGSAGRSAPQL
jgi:hypothetical protein